MNNKFTIIFQAVALYVSLLGFVSCGGSEPEDPVAAPSLTAKSSVDVTADAGSLFLSVTSAGDWAFDQPDSWLELSALSGTGDKNNIILSYEANEGEARTADLTLRNAGGSATLTITQAKKEDNQGGGTQGGGTQGGTVSPDTKLGWLELPATNTDDGYDFVTHSMEIGNVTTRNYSFYWDYDNLVSIWVAYPLCSWNIGGSVKRTNAWGYDPSLPRDSQPNLASGFSEGNSGWYARGHQIPSADRLTSYSANAATFYGTNMTPQLNNNFNATIWADLESEVRSWAVKSDTLYVVTGCVVEGSEKYALDNDGKRVTVPVAYFKALLRYSKTSTYGHSGYMSNAFWFEHKDYTDSKVSSEYALSVSDLEEKLGYELFVNLPNAVGSDVAKTIKDEDPVSVSWWW